MQGAYERDPEILENLIRSLFNDAVSTEDIIQRRMRWEDECECWIYKNSEKVDSDLF